MKAIIFKHTNEPEFIIKNYTGFIGNEKYDAPVHTALPYTNKQLKFTCQDAYNIPNVKYKIIEETFIIDCQKKLFSAHPDNFMIAVAFIFNNLSRHGNATIAIDFIGPLADIITYLSVCFKTCKIIYNESFYLELENFCPPKPNYIISYLRYYFDKGTVSPFRNNLDRERVNEIFNKLIH